MPEKRADGNLTRNLLRWYKTCARKLPWRGGGDPYKIWVSEVMLQQTTVPAVVPRYEKWIALFPDIQTLARSSLRQVLKAWEGLGYYQRARNLHSAARLIDQRHSGSLPQKYDDLIALPGFGPYITAAVLSIAFGQPHLVLDANIRRILT
ncbi:MAG: A/G-specific adenine glycosylase, partial [Acidobacteriota bacterium]